MPSKFTIEQVRVFFEERGYALLSTEYINKDTPLRFLCPEHPDEETYISLGSLRNGRGCYYCGQRKKRQFKKHSFAFVKKIRRGRI